MLASTRARLERKSTRYLDGLCATLNCSYKELYQNHRDQLTHGLKMQLFYILNKRKKIKKKRLEKEKHENQG